MRRQSFRSRHRIVAAIACLVGGLLGQRAAANGPLPIAASQAEGKPTTIVGCVVQGLPDAGTGGPAPAAASAQDYFVRTATVRVPPGTTVAVGTPGTASTSTSTGVPAEASFYRIEGLSADELRPHVGHRAEVQGRLTDNTPGVETTRATTTQDKEGRATTRVETRIAIAGVLHATTIKMVSGDCQN